MRRIRPRSAYDVLALIALFLAIGGGTALASYVISSNRQVGPNTVSGHKPPSGDHSNIIGGTVNGKDLANGAVSNAKLANGSVSLGKMANNSINGAKVANGSLTGSDLALNNVSSALGIRTAYAETECTPTCAPGTPLYSQGPWTLTGFCVFDSNDGSLHARIELNSAPGDAAIVAVNEGDGQRVASGNVTTIAQTGTVAYQDSATASKGGEFSAVLANADLDSHISGHVLAVADGGGADNHGAGFCKFAFEGIGQ
jgi:hypothetical protein